MTEEEQLKKAMNLGLSLGMDEKKIEFLYKGIMLMWENLDKNAHEYLASYIVLRDSGMNAKDTHFIIKEAFIIWLMANCKKTLKEMREECNVSGT